MAASDKFNQSVLTRSQSMKHFDKESFENNSMKWSKHRHSMGSFDNIGYSEEQPYQFNAQEDDYGYQITRKSRDL